MIPQERRIVTLFIGHRDATTKAETWARVVLCGVAFKQTTVRSPAGSMSGAGMITLTKQTTMQVPAGVRVRSADNDELQYVEPAEYSRLGPNDRPDAWTLKTGDLIVLGEVPEEIDTEYPLKNLLQDYPDTATIKAVLDARGSPVLRHWQVDAL